MHWMISSTDAYAKAECQRIFKARPSSVLLRSPPSPASERSEWFSPLPLAGEDAEHGEAGEGRT